MRKRSRKLLQIGHEIWCSPDTAVFPLPSGDQVFQVSGTSMPELLCSWYALIHQVINSEFEWFYDIPSSHHPTQHNEGCHTWARLSSKRMTLKLGIRKAAESKKLDSSPAQPLDARNDARKEQ